MKTRPHFLLYTLLLITALFAIGKLTFLCYNSEVETLHVGQTLATWLAGLPLDLRTAALLLLVPALCSLQTRIPLRPLLVPYYILIALATAVVVVANTIMYEFWQFNLSAVVLSYAASPEGATSSVSLGFILWRVAAVLAFAFVMATGCIALLPQRGRKQWTSPLLIAVLALLPVGIGTCYHSRQTLFRNHTATNPLYAFVTSFWLEDTFHRLNETEQAEVFAPLYPADTEDVTDTLLNTRRPNILLIQLESFGAQFVAELGGLPQVTPNLSRWIPQGVFWEQFYSNSFRTDRGSVTIQSGTISHPTVSLMRDTLQHPALPSLPRTLQQAGYSTSVLYAGVYTNMGKGRYYRDMGLNPLHGLEAFGGQPWECGWGMHDGTAALKVLDLLHQSDSTKPWMFTFQTLSSHEPWQVPYHRLEDKRLNAFAYTDSCVGALLDSLSRLPLWDNLLVIVLPDHGYLYHQTYEDPQFFHAPMLWLGGAVKRPRRINVLMNQSDLAATLLSQLGISHKHFPWSRNVLSRNYTYPFVYSNYPAGLLFKDSTGVSLFDLAAGKAFAEQPAPSPERIRKAQAILQESYKHLQK